jgi:hypothetical protein
MLAGSVAGMTSLLVVQPMDVIRCGRGKRTAALAALFPHSVDVIMHSERGYKPQTDSRVPCSALSKL